MSVTERAYDLALAAAEIDRDNLDRLATIAKTPYLLWDGVQTTIKAERQRAAILRQQLRDITNPAEYRAAMLAALRTVEEEAERDERRPG